MGYRNTTSEYGTLAKFFHWLIFLLVLCMLLAGYFMSDLSDKAVRSQVVNVHKIMGVFILFIMLMRMVWALNNIKPLPMFNSPAWQKHIERIVHFLLYALLIAMPITGWIMSSAAGKPPHIGEWHFGLPIPKSKAIDDLFWNAHSWLAIVIIAVVSLHILAALYHYVVKKDQVLQRMF